MHTGQLRAAGSVAARIERWITPPSLRAAWEQAAYVLLRGLAHRRWMATEEQLDAAATQCTVQEFERGVQKADKLIARFDGNVPIDPQLSYLDLGCGNGAVTIALAQRGLREVTGVDFLPRSIERARGYARQLGVAERVEFLCADLRAWEPSRRYDVLLSFDALEHIAQPQAFLARMQDFAAPGGVAVLAFGPLFHSPFGDHMTEFFRVQIPWRGVLFPEKTILRLRSECYRPTDPARRYEDIAGGLNLMRYSEFLRAVDETGWKFRYLAFNTFLRRWPLARRLSDAAMRTPLLQDYVGHNVYCVLARK
jgi:2-polyprenyl-3-methyl-5-hydroxy-6-metoxy-1,4-benzoquinol methylase